jgi:glucose/arabinose dehydrogenase
VTVLAAVAAGCGSGGTTGGLVPIGAGLRGPSGLRASVYATGLRHVSAFALDRRGRLWVTTSGATTHGSDGVYLVRKAGARPVKVVSGLRAPLGLVWVGRRLYVASLGRVDAFGGLRGTRFATRTRILKGPVSGGENNNLVLAPNGRLVMSVSASCDHCVPSSRWSAAIVSFRPDGSDLRLYASRVRAGFGLAFYPGTSDLFVSMNQRDDLGAKTPGDWLSLVRRGDDWGFPACYGQDGAACAGVPSPTAVLDPHAAAGGVAIVTGQLGTAVGTAALVSEWQLGKVQRVALTKTGSGYAGSVSPFLTGLKSPLPLLTTPDGGVLVGDWATGIVYRIA